MLQEKRMFANPIYVGTVLAFSVRFYGYLPEPEFLNIYWRLKSRLSVKSCLFKGQRVQQGSDMLQFLFADRKHFLSKFKAWQVV